MEPKTKLYIGTDSSYKRKRTIMPHSGNFLLSCGPLRPCNHFLYEKFTVFTDNTALHWLMNITKLSARITRWKLHLSDCDFEIKYRKDREKNLPMPCGDCTHQRNKNSLYLWFSIGSLSQNVYGSIGKLCIFRRNLRYYGLRWKFRWKYGRPIKWTISSGPINVGNSL